MSAPLSLYSHRLNKYKNLTKNQIYSPASFLQQFDLNTKIKVKLI